MLQQFDQKQTHDFVGTKAMLWEFLLRQLRKRQVIYFYKAWLLEDELPDTVELESDLKVKAGEGTKPTPKDRVEAPISQVPRATSQLLHDYT